MSDAKTLTLAAKMAFDSYNVRIGKRTRMTEGQAKEVVRAVCEAVLEMMPSPDIEAARHLSMTGRLT